MPLRPEVYDDYLDVRVEIGGTDWHLVECRVELTTSDTPDYVDMIIAPSEKVPDSLLQVVDTKDQGLLGDEFILEVDTALEAGPRGEQEITRLFTGNLANISPTGKGVWEAIAWDPSHQIFEEGSGKGTSGNFLNSKIQIPAAASSKNVQGLTSYENQLLSYADSSDTTASKTRIKASKLLDKIIEEAKERMPGIEIETHIEDGGLLIGTGPNGQENRGGFDRELSFADEEITIQKALNTIQQATFSETWFDREGVYHIGAPRPGNPVHKWELQFIKNTTAGLSTPAWNSVQVIGSGVVSEEGWDRMNMFSSDKVVSGAGLGSDEETQTDLLAEPVYTYRNMEIQTQAEADAVRQSILEKLKEQQAEGKVTVVGFPEVRPLDAIVMPSSETQPISDPDDPAEYGVVKVVHKLNGSDGFITDIHVGGLTHWNEVLLNEDLVSGTGGGGPSGAVSQGPPGGI